MPIPLDKKLYEEVKKEADKIYIKHSAYKSGYIVKKYLEKGGKYLDDKKEKTLSRWFNEKWTDINPNKTKNTYPVYRPTIRINKKTPKTKDEIPLKKVIEQSKLKQNIKGDKLPKF